VTGVDPAAFRKAAGRLPTGIVVVGTCVDGTPHVMTVSAFTSVSLDPLLVLFCAEKIARFHDAVLAAGTWSVSILDEDAEKTSRWLATRGRPLEGQLDGIPHHMGEVTGAPLLDGALAGLECRTTAVHDGGDHSIIVGEVVGVTGPAPGDPLIYFGGAYRRKDRAGIAGDLERVLGLFPRLKERIDGVAGNLSGGEQQMLAIGRALLAKPRLLLLDEPSMGLAPIIVQGIFRTLRDINRDGLTIFLVEQNVRQALKVAQHGYVLENGRIVLEGRGSELLDDPKVLAAYLGG